MFKKRLEGFFYGFLVASFFLIMEWNQEGHIGKFFIIGMCLIPFFGAWWFTSRFAKGFFDDK